MIPASGWKRDLMIGACLLAVLSFFASRAHGADEEECRMLRMSIQALAEQARQRDVIADIQFIPREPTATAGPQFMVHAGLRTRDNHATIGTAIGVHDGDVVETLIETIRGHLQHVIELDWRR